MLLDVISDHLEVTEGVCGGRPRIAGRRVTVHDVAVWHEKLSQSADQIASDYGLSLAEIHAALVYYFDHRDEIDRQLSDEEQFVNSMRAGHDSPLQRKLEARRSENSDPILPG